MSTHAISSVAQTSLSALVGAIQGSRRQGGSEDRDASGGGGQGINLLASLLEALTQAASAQSSAASGATSGAAAAGTSTTTGATGTTATNATIATTGTPPAGGSAATTGTPGSILVQDLQTFLHDLFRALRHVSRSDDDGGRSGPSRPAATGGASATATVPVPVPVGAGAYRPHGIISALQTLIQDLSKGPAAGNTNAISSTRFSTLNAAFEKLIADLSGTPAPVAGTTSDIGTSSTSGTSTTASGTSPDGSTPDASAAGSTPSTAALQSFLINFAQDLQNYGTHSLRTLGTSINTTA